MSDQPFAIYLLGTPDVHQSVTDTDICCPLGGVWPESHSGCLC